MMELFYILKYLVKIIELHLIHRKSNLMILLIIKKIF